MKKFISILLGLLFVTTGILAQDAKSRTVSTNDSLTLMFKLSKDDKIVQNTVATLLTNSVQTNTAVADGLEKLSAVMQEGLELNKQSKLDRIAREMNTNKQSLLKSFKRNGQIMLVALFPMLIFVLWAMYEFIVKKGLDIGKMIIGTALMALYALVGSAALYAVLSLLFNSQYFEIKNLLSTLF
jgi:hypothetical protein